MLFPEMDEGLLRAFPKNLLEGFLMKRAVRQCDYSTVIKRNTIRETLNKSIEAAQRYMLIDSPDITFFLE